MQSIRLVQFTDPHLVDDPADSLRGINTLASLRHAMAHAAARFEAADGIVLSGDLVHDDAAGYRHVVNEFGHLKLPVYCVPGNHDLPEQMRVALARTPFQVGGHDVVGNWLLILLDSYAPNTAGGRIGAEQLQTLHRTLELHADKHALVFLHHHPIKMRSEWLDTVGLQDADEFRAVIARHKNVRGIAWGHVHQSLDLFSGGVRYMATPSTCSQFKPLSADFALDNKPPGYRTFELMADGTIATEVVWLDNAACSSHASAA